MTYPSNPKYKPFNHKRYNKSKKPFRLNKIKIMDIREEEKWMNNTMKCSVSKSKAVKEKKNLKLINKIYSIN